MHVKVWVFLGVARTMVGTLCVVVCELVRVFSVSCMTALSCTQETPKLGTKICTGPELTQNTHCMCVTKFRGANTKVSKDRQPLTFLLNNRV